MTTFSIDLVNFAVWCRLYLWRIVIIYIYYRKPKVLYFYKIIIIKVWRLEFKPFYCDILFIYGIWLFLNRLWFFIYKFYWFFFHERDKNLYNFFPLQYYYLTGSTASTFLEYIQRNLPEGVAMKVTKVNIFSETYMYAVYWYIYQKVFSSSLQLPLFILLLTFFF